MTNIDKPLAKILFETNSLLGFDVRVTESYWNLLCTKHPEVRDQLAAIISCIKSPDTIRRSKKDEKVYLMYMQHGQYWLCVVAKRINGKGFVITAYITDKIKEGVLIWQK